MQVGLAVKTIGSGERLFTICPI